MATKKYNERLSQFNPFSDSQARNYSDELLADSFYPNKKFWSLFNDQHEVVVGTRGCGKTTLLRMMSYTSLKRVKDPKAEKLVRDKDYICLFIALHLEYISKHQNSDSSEADRVSWFYFLVSCKLALAILDELKTLLDDIFGEAAGVDNLARAQAEYRLAQSIDSMWEIDSTTSAVQLSNLAIKVAKLYSNVSNISDLLKVPTVFKNTMGGVLSCISRIICEELKFTHQPTWIVCIDEAEFTDDIQQKCINTAFRSDTNRIAYKVATLHFYHKTQKTLSENADALKEQDYKYTNVDLNCDHDDFKNLANSIVRNRLARVEVNEINKVKDFRLEDFIETANNDEPSDYYEKELRKTRDNIADDILMHVAANTYKHYVGKSIDDRKKPLTDKLAPIFILREMKKRAGTGNNKVNWFVGANMVRRISQGNPRIFIQLMWNIYNVAISSASFSLPIKTEIQYNAITDFSARYCETTVELKRIGDEAKISLERIAKFIETSVHDRPLGNAGISFVFNLSDQYFENQKDWIQEAVAFSRLIIDKQPILGKITKDTSFMLVNAYAVKYWLPMQRRKSPPYNITKKILDTVPLQNSSGSQSEALFPEQLKLQDIGGGLCEN